MPCRNLTARIGLDPDNPKCFDIGLGLLVLLFVTVFVCVICDCNRGKRRKYGRVEIVA